LYKKFGIENEYLDAYINEREECFAKCRFEKTDFLKVINDKNYEGNNVFLKNFHNNLFKKLIPILKEYPKDIWESVLQSRKANVKNNREGSFISHILQDMEIRCLEGMNHSFMSQ